MMMLGDIEIVRTLNAAAAGPLAPLAVAAAGWVVYLLAVLVLVPVVSEKSWRAGLRISATIAGGGMIAFALRWIIGEIFFRPRPFVTFSDITPLVSKSADSPAFPSGHASAAFAIAFGLFLWNRRLGTVAFILAGIVAIGRVAVGVHYPTDVLGGAAIGILSAWVIFKSTHYKLPTTH